MLFQGLPHDYLPAADSANSAYSAHDGAAATRGVQRFECFDPQPAYPFEAAYALIESMPDGAQRLPEEWARLLTIWACGAVEAGL